MVVAVVNYTLDQAQRDIAQLRGQLAHQAASATFLNITIAGQLVLDTWHSVTVDTGTSGWSGGNGIFYRLTAWHTVQVFGSSVTGTTMAAGTTRNVNGSNALPVAYRPTKTWNISGAGIPGRMGAEITSSGVIIAINGAGSAVTAATEVDIAGEYPIIDI